MTALTISGLEVVRGTQRVLRGVDISVDTGEIVALMGLSGAGKTTVIRAVAALQPFSAGSISRRDAARPQADLHAYRLARDTRPQS